MQSFKGSSKAIHVNRGNRKSFAFPKAEPQISTWGRRLPRASQLNFSPNLNLCAGAWGTSGTSANSPSPLSGVTSDKDMAIWKELGFVISTAIYWSECVLGKGGICRPKVSTVKDSAFLRPCTAQAHPTASLETRTLEEPKFKRQWERCRGRPTVM